MYANNFEQLTSFIIFTIIGLIISIVFDFFRILRKTFKTPDLITCIEDIVFWIISGIIILISIFIFNNGELRLYIFIGILIGIILYMIFISKYFIKFNVYVINCLKYLINKILQIILKPIVFIYKLIKKAIFKPISFIFINFRKIITKIKNKFKKIKILNKKIDKKEGI